MNLSIFKLVLINKDVTKIPNNPIKTAKTPPKVPAPGPVESIIPKTIKRNANIANEKKYHL